MRSQGHERLERVPEVGEGECDVFGWEIDDGKGKVGCAIDLYSLSLGAVSSVRRTCR